VQAGRVLREAFTLTIAEGRALVDTISRYGAVWQCGMQRRSDQATSSSYDVIHSGRIGKLTAVTMFFWGIWRRQRWTAGSEPEPNLEEFDYNRWLGQSPWMPYSKLGSSRSWRVKLDLAAASSRIMGPHFVQIAQWIRGGGDSNSPIEFTGDAAYHPEDEYNATPIS